MRKINNNMSFAYMIEVMYTHSDEDNKMRREEINNVLFKEYNFKIENTHTFCKYINDMIAIGVPIKQEYEGKEKVYYISSDKLDYCELKLISDCLSANKSLTYNKTTEILKKLYNLNKNIYAKYSLNSNNLIENRSKTNNEDILENINLIYDSITYPRQISFKYCYYDKDHQLVEKDKDYKGIAINLVIRNEYYYLIFKNDDGVIANYRVDKIKKVRILDEVNDDDDDMIKKFDVTSFLKKSIKMFSGKEDVTVRLKVLKDWIAGYLKDELGEDCKIKCENNELAAEFQAFMSEGLIKWIMSMGKDVEVIEPLELREKIKDRALEIAALYN